MFNILKITILFICFVGLIGQPLSSANMVNNVMRSKWRVSGNSIGLSMDLQQVIPHLDNALFQKFHKNSFFYGDWNAIFQQTLHVKPGTRYKCEQIANYTNSNISNCLIELNNATLLDVLGNYIYNYTDWYAFIIGWDMKNTNFTNNTYITNIFAHFVKALYQKAKNQPFIVEMVDMGDQYAALGLNPNYTAKQLVKDCKSVNSNIYGIIMVGPGATQNATKQWYKQNSNIYYQCGLFSFRAYVFENADDMNISNLLSEHYTQAYWQRRFVFQDVDALLDYDLLLGMVNDFKITKDPRGLDGFSNTFAAAIFLLQSTLEYFYVGGFYISFYNPILEQSFQSPYGQAPKFAPSALYYSLLLLSLSTRRYPYIQRPNTVAGTSKSIKVYGLRYWGTTYGVIIINKDQNVNTTGVVQITIRDNSGITCIYFKADRLNSTSGFTLGGVSFISGNATYQGNFTSQKYTINANNNYEVRVNYSQVVFCKTEATVSTYPFPRGSSSKFQAYTTYLPLLLLFITLLS